MYMLNGYGAKLGFPVIRICHTDVLEACLEQAHALLRERPDCDRVEVTRDGRKVAEITRATR